MAYLRQVELIDILSQLPEIEPLNKQISPLKKGADLFLCALGFEDRCLSIPELIAKTVERKCTEALYFEYATNVNDNEVNKPRLLKALQSFNTLVNPMPCDSDDFSMNFRNLLSRVCNKCQTPSVVFDISACSSKPLLLALKILFEFDLRLCMVYSEAKTYHPTREEFKKNPHNWTTEEGFGLSRGVSAVIPSAEHPGYRRDRLQEVAVIFPTFKPERARAIIADTDEALITGPKDKITWIIGNPHLKKDNWRTDAIREINKIQTSAPSYEVSTFNYKETIQTLERIYRSLDCKYHMTISPLGSKMQSLGIALFWYMRQDISIVFATPKEYNARQYSEGCRRFWQIDFGELTHIRGVLDNVGQLKIVG